MDKKATVQAAYNGSELDFPIITGMMCHSCITSIGAFAGHKPKYTKAFVQEILDRVKAASLIPNIEQRQAQSVALGKVVSAGAGTCADNFLTLFSYMESAFTKAQLPGMKKMAGGTFYDTARKNWSDATSMNGMVITFIDTYSTELTDAGMPSGFPQQCADDKQAFSTALDEYESYKGIAEQQRQDKINANNGVYNSLRSMMKDGKFIFRKDEALRRQFTWSAVLAKVSKNARSGFTIRVNAPQEGKIVTTARFLVDGYKPFFANEKGIITAKLPEGTWTGVITAPGFLPLTVTFMSDKGITHREEVALTIAIANAG